MKTLKNNISNPIRNKFLSGANRLKKFKIIIFISAAFLVLPMSALALGQMSQPIIIDNAMRGEQIHQEIIAVNTEKGQIAIEFTASGDIKDWVKFYNPKDLKNPVATTTIAGSANLSMTAVFSVPADAPNGEYTGAVSVTSLPDAYKPKGESSASLAQKIDREVTIKVSDTEVISLEASVIPKTYDLAPKEALSVRIIYDNQSNISLTPSINFKIKNNDKTVYNVIYPYPEGEPAVNPQAMREIPALSIQTTDLAQGKYLAQLSFMRGDKVILEKQFGFSIGSSNALFATKIINLFKGNLLWLLGIIAVILLALAGLLAKRNMDIKNEISKKFKIVKKKFIKAFKLVKTGIAGLF